MMTLLHYDGTPEVVMCKPVLPSWEILRWGKRTNPHANGPTKACRTIFVKSLSIRYCGIVLLVLWLWFPL